MLVADDNADMRAYAARLLGGRWSVELGARRARRRSSAIRETTPDLVLADVMMPGLDGFGLLRAVRADPATREMPVILLSARAGEEARVEGLEAGADDYLVKPFSARELVARVGAALELARVRRDAAASLRGSEEALRQRTAQFETLVAEAPLGVYLVDDAFRIREVNPPARPAFGGIPDLIGRDFDEVMHRFGAAPYADEVVRLFRHTLETGAPYATPERIEQRLDTGVTEYYEWWINRIPLPDGRYGVVCWFRDISAQVSARAAVAETQERLRQSAKMEAIGRLAGGLAHDFNNQLQALTGFARYASLDPGIGPRARQDLDQVQKAATRLADLTRQLLAFSRQQILQPELLDMDEAVGEGLELLRRLIGEPGRVPDRPRPRRQVGARRSHADPAGADEPVHQREGRDARAAGGWRFAPGSATSPRRCKRRTRGRPSRRAGTWSSPWRTPGPASRPTTCRTSSSRSSPPRRSARAPGSASRRCTASSRRARATSTPRRRRGAGAASRCCSPRRRRPRGQALPTRAGAGAASPSPTVLIVEDEVSVRELLARILADEGYETLQAGHGKEALALLEQHGDRVALVLTDIVMPVMGGKELAARLAATHPDLPLVWMSGHPSDSTFETAQTDMGHPILTKPTDLDVLVATVRDALARASSGGSKHI